MVNATCGHGDVNMWLEFERENEDEHIIRYGVKIQILVLMLQHAVYLKIHVQLP